MILIRPPRIRQPAPGVGINWGHPMARGLLMLMPLDMGNFVELVTRSVGARTGSGALMFRNGAYELFGTSSYIDLPFVPAVGTTGPATFAWTQEPRGTSAYSTIANINFGSGTSSFAIYQSASDSAYYFSCGPRNGTPSAIITFSTGAVTNGVLDRYVLRVTTNVLSTNTADYQLWRNGVQQTQGSTTTFGSHTGAVKRIGALDTGGDPFEGSIGNFHIWNRALSDAEAQAWSLNEFIVRAPFRRRIWFGVTAAGGNVFNPLSGRGGAAAQPLVLH